jgi:hypothetical protein
MAEIINLRRARKGKLRTEAETKAAENRVRFGRTKAERMKEEAEAERAITTLDGHKREDL